MVKRFQRMGCIELFEHMVIESEEDDKISDETLSSDNHEVQETRVD